ncbi:MAG: thioredoxin family protein [Solobacterium sp.]|jgi:thioredoxin 1|nr:thioredoxin family protein [Solobacterium sp.]MCH4048224.1 thioredoxin family protein [Solobacterium sp.]MCH4074922.1 thioredoxin family protein [Solobacterium sp.]
MKKITLSSFKEEALEAEKPVVLLFSSAWCTGCGPEKNILTALEEVHANLSFLEINADQETEINTLMHVSHLPAVFAMYHGKILDHTAGFQPAERMKQMCDLLESVL